MTRLSLPNNHECKTKERLSCRPFALFSQLLDNETAVLSELSAHISAAWLNFTPNHASTADEKFHLLASRSFAGRSGLKTLSGRRLEQAVARASKNHGDGGNYTYKERLIVQ
jgi:hypothetical protein